MKTKSLLACTLFSGVSLCASATAHLTGKVTNYSGGNILLIQMNDSVQQNDTMKIAKDGSFAKDVKVLGSSIAYFGLEDKKAFCQVFMEDGIRLNINMTENKMGKKEEADVQPVTFEYLGDNKDCYDYLKSHDTFNLLGNWPFERLDTISFNAYRQQWTAEVESYKRAANQTKSQEFRRQMGQQLDAFASHELFRWVWADNKSHLQDKDFVNWVESIDHNDIENMDFCESYLRWYSKAHPLKEKGGSFTILTKAFTNQDIINSMADDQIVQFLRQAPEDMDEQMAAYKQVSTNKKGWAEADKVYAHYSKLKKGSLAADFTMTDRNGKQFSLADLRGKAVYIDCWATWCGPCCLEIPYMEKLYQHYKDNKNIELISISLDTNKQKWFNKLKADKPQWRQFICPDNFQSKLCQNYDIDAIPRFLFFDKEGRIISLDAPRPSNEDIIKFIDDCLQK